MIYTPAEKTLFTGSNLSSCYGQFIWPINAPEIYKKWESMDTFIEVHDKDNTEAIYNYFSGTKINIFAQQLGWEKVHTIEDMPPTPQEGYIFMSQRSEMPWQRP